MTKYITRALPVEAFRFNNEALKDLPTWLREYEDFSPFGGKSPVTRTPIGNLLIPAPDKSHEVVAGEWAVLYLGKVIKLRDAEFNVRFEPVVEAQTAAPAAETPSPSPVESPTAPSTTAAGSQSTEPPTPPVSAPAAQVGGGDTAP